MVTQLRAVLAGLLLLLTLSSSAQTQTLTGFSNFRKSALSPIYEGNEVKGYTLFYKADKADKKNDNYGIDLFDQDLNKVKTVLMPKPKNWSYLLGNTFNGTAFSFYFFNRSKMYLEIDSYDKSLKKIGSVQITDLSRAAKVIIDMESKSPGSTENDPFSGLKIYPVANKGFIRTDYVGLMSGYVLEMYDNNMNLKWKSQTDNSAKDIEALLVNEITDKYLLATIARKPNKLSTNITFYIAAFDINTGKKVMDQPVESAKTDQLSLSSLSFDETSQEFVTIGEFYKPDDKPFINKSQGLYIKRFNSKGQEVAFNKFGWTNEVRALLPASAKKGIDENFINYVQKVLKGSDGKFYVVTEQYKIVGKGGVALAAIGAGISVTKGVVGDMMVYEFDPTYKLNQVKHFPKDESKCMLPNTAALYGAGMLGHLMKSLGAFDYEFAQVSNDASELSVAYLNYDKEKNQPTKKTAVNILLGDESNYKVDKMDVSSSKSNYSVLYPAKPGYNLVVDHNFKEKVIGMKLVRLNK